MRFLVFGCNGMAGHIISLYLKEAGHDVLGFARTDSKFVPTIIGDALEKKDVAEAVLSSECDVVVNCIGILNQFAESNKSEAVFLNSYLPHFLVDITSNSSTRVIHMSTDCVFSGAKGSYTESDFQDGSTFYDRTKALGEIVDNKNLTLRNSIVGPDIKVSGIGLLNWFMQQEGPVGGYTNSIWTGQTTLQLAKTIEAAALDGAYGLVNAVPSSSISKYELLNLFNENLRGGSVRIEPVENKRVDKSLKRTNWEFDYVIPDYTTMVLELAEWMRRHKSLYPHYSIA